VLPAGRVLTLAGRGTTYVRECGPVGGRPLLLLHGWTANADLNWAHCYAPLAAAGFRVVALDHRGHSRGIRDPRPFRLEDCADDAAALVGALGLGSVTAVGYSMGGPIAQLLWRRHPHLVDRLVLCATAQTFNTSARERALFALLAGAGAAARRLQPQRLAALAMAAMTGRHVDPASWAWAFEQLARHDWLQVIEAGRCLGRFDSRGWAPTIDVPTACVVTLEDHVVPPGRQLDLAAAVPGATVQPVAGDHAACLVQPDDFVPALLAGVGAHANAA